jgi:hypothetical protein
LDFTLSALPESADQLPDNFDWFDDETFADPGAAIGYEAFEDSNLDPRGQLDFLDQRFREAATNLPDSNTLIDGDSQITAYQFDNVVDSMLGASVSFAEGTWQQPQLNQSLRENSSDSNQANGRSEGAPPSTIIRTSTLPQQRPLLLQTSMAAVQAQNIPLDANGKMICKHLGCSNSQTFERKCDWQ